VDRERLWAPWRLAYLAAEKPADHDREACFLCRVRDAADDAGNLVVHRSPHSLVVLNRYPYNNGHLLIAPRDHKGTLAELTDDELLDSAHLLRRMVAVLQELIQAQGFNVGLNLGKAAGAGLPGHLHWHVVPRWVGDSNFMTTVGDVRVISQSLDELQSALRAALAPAT
jgi:ATP adenylyltransferase